MENKKIPVILDGDPGHDDAIAWVLAKARPELDILAMTTVAGNQTLDKTTYNTRRICALVGIEAPIAVGCDRPLMSELFTAGNYHGETGLDGAELPEPDRELSELSAMELMVKTLQEAKEPVTIIVTGPETNVGALLLAHPELKEKIKMISVMGGGLFSGNWTPAAEFNILEDPEAASVVYNSGIPIQMCGLDVTERALVLPEEVKEIRAIGNPVSDVVANWLDFFMLHHLEMGYAGAPLHDPCAVISLLRPDLFTIEEMRVDIETCGRYGRGATVGNFGTTKETENAGPVNCKVVLDVKRREFVEWIMETLHYYDGKEGNA